MSDIKNTDWLGMTAKVTTNMINNSELEPEEKQLLLENSRKRIEALREQRAQRLAVRKELLKTLGPRSHLGDLDQPFDSILNSKELWDDYPEHTKRINEELSKGPLAGLITISRIKRRIQSSSPYGIDLMMSCSRFSFRVENRLKAYKEYLKKLQEKYIHEIDQLNLSSTRKDLSFMQKEIDARRAAKAEMLKPK